jgi:hypothetical protein
MKHYSETKPPEHAVEPSRRPELKVLSGKFDAQAKAFSEVKELKGPGAKADRERNAKFAARAAEHSLDLHGYWSHVIHCKSTMPGWRNWQTRQT